MGRVLMVAGLLGASVLLIAGCASIIKGTSQNISIQSEPDSAAIVIKTIGGLEVFKGTTPANPKLAKKKEYIVTISLDGYKETQIGISQKFDALALGNIICGGVIGLIIDAADGAMYELEPDQIRITLVTAMLENDQKKLYAVIYMLDDDGQLRSMAVPMIRECNITCAR